MAFAAPEPDYCYEFSRDHFTVLITYFNVVMVFNDGAVYKTNIAPNRMFPDCDCLTWSQQNRIASLAVEGGLVEPGDFDSELDEYVRQFLADRFG